MQNLRLPKPTWAPPVVLFLVLLFTVVFPAPAGAQTYSVQMLGALGGDFSEAVSINEAGQVVGNVSITPGGVPSLAFLYDNGVMTAFPGNGNFGTAFSLAHGINNLGQVTGQARVGDVADHAFLWSSGTVTDLGALPGASDGSGGFAVNDLGAVVGISKNEGMIYENGKMTGFSRRGARLAYDINNVGQIVGFLQNNRAFVFDQKTLKDLGTLDGGQNSMSTATSINNSGQIVGFANSNGSSHAFLYENGVMRDLGTLRGGNSGALGINNQGAIVGESDGSAFLYQNGQMIDLNSAIDPGFVHLRYARAINDSGQIVGMGRFFTVGDRGFILTPLP